MLRRLLIIISVIMVGAVLGYFLLVGPSRAWRCRGGVVSYIQGFRNLEEEVDLPKYSEANSIERVVIDGNEALPALLEAINTAEHHIHIETMFFLDDEAGRIIAKALSDAAKRGVQVRLLFDWELSSTIDSFGIISEKGEAQLDADIERLIGEMRAAGVQILNSYPLTKEVPFDIDPSISDKQLSGLDEICVTINHRDHRKIMVFDGDLAIFGGMNIASHYLYDEPFDPLGDNGRSASNQWHDFQIHLRGDVVADLNREFVKRWQLSEGDTISLDDPEFFPSIDSEGNVRIKTLRQSPGQQEISTAYYELISNAQEEIWIESPYVLHEPLIEALHDAIERGVRVVLIVPGKYHDSPLVRSQMITSYGEWLAGGIELYEYEDRMLHDKVMIVDGRWITLGSFNLDARSYFHDLEINILVDNPDFAEFMLRELIETDIRNSIQIEDPPSHPWYWNLFNIARPFS